MNNNMSAVQTTTQVKSLSGTAPTKPANNSAAKQLQQQQPQPPAYTAKQQPYASPSVRKHEEFKNQLVHDVFGRDNKGRVPMEKVTMLIWQFRDDPAVVQFMAQFVARFSGSRSTYDGIEFYLPQIAHMIIHLEADWDEAILERFALVIAQQSQHFALQLTWILEGAIEDYQPETVEGKPNPGYNQLFYQRCITLLSNIERCVVYGSPRSMELQRMYEKGDITRDEYEQMKLVDRFNNAKQITTHGANFRNLMQRMKDTKISMPELKLERKKGKEKENATSATATDPTPAPSDPGSPSMTATSNDKGKQISKYGGTLLYKRPVRTACYKPKRWKSRYFEIEERMLYCYNFQPKYGGQLRRAMPLEGATVEVFEGKYPFMFVVKNHHFEYIIRAKSEKEMLLWMKLLRGESEANALIPHILSTDEMFKEKEEKGDDETKRSSPNTLTPSQEARYEFFRNERDFVAAVCDVAEVLRFREPSDRKKVAPGLVSDIKLPPCGYVPLCKSTDIWRRVDSVMASETRVFNTNERCPMIYYFIAKRGEPVGSTLEPRNPNLDVAEYLHTLFKVPDLENRRLTSIGEHVDELQLGDSGDDSDDKDKGEVKVEDPDEDYDEFELTMEDPTENRNSVWSEESKTSKSFLSSSMKGMKGNQQFREFMQESFAKLPSKIATRMSRPDSRPQGRKGRVSYLDRNSAPLVNVPIIDTPIVENVNEDDHESAADSLSLDGQSIISAGTGSIVFGDTIKQFEHHDGVNKESLDRAKAVVCGGESWAEQSARMLQSGKKEGEEKDESTLLEIVTMMAKSNDDLRQEVFVMQMIHYFESVFAKANVPVWLKTYRILSTSKSTGMLEFLTDATSIDSLYKSDKFPKTGGLRAYFEQVYGPPTSKDFLAAQRNFIRSLAGYSLVAYLLGLKDRHNGNIMIDTRGHIIHIDFGFAFGMAPGHEWSFERAPFKLTQDYIDVMGGPYSEGFKEFQKLFVDGLKAARSNSLNALGLVEIMMYKSNYPCFSGPRYGGGVALKRFEKRLLLDVPQNKVEMKARKLIKSSMDHAGTKLYDIFQYHSNGYAY
eukprot:scaffold2305_cov145-Skeletonema_menzelii.AAC.8